MHVTTLYSISTALSWGTVFKYQYTPFIIIGRLPYTTANRIINDSTFITATRALQEYFLQAE